jgi:hypothetical protein
MSASSTSSSSSHVTPPPSTMLGSTRSAQIVEHACRSVDFTPFETR